MRAIELKLGNFITSNGILCRVISIDRNGVIAEPVKFRGERFTANIEPVFLTKEWLSKFNFILYETDIKYYALEYGLVDKEGNYSNSFLIDEDINGFFYFKINTERIIILFVNQLQNLFFEITGEELEFK